MRHRIVSLVPSLTEWLVALGLEDELVGITTFCVHPPHLKSRITKVGGTKNPNIDRIRELQPTVVVLNKEENRPEDADALSEFTTLLVTEISSVTQAWEEMKRIARYFGKSEDRANELHSLWERIQKPGNNASVLYLIWRNPWMAAGSETYISSVLEHLGYQNVLKNEKRYPQLTQEQLMELSPNYVFLSSEPYPFKKQHLEEVQHLFPNSNVVLVDGEKYSWYGERMSWVEELL